MLRILGWDGRLTAGKSPRGRRHDAAMPEGSGWRMLPGKVWEGWAWVREMGRFAEVQFVSLRLRSA